MSGFVPAGGGRLIGRAGADGNASQPGRLLVERAGVDDVDMRGRSDLHYAVSDGNPDRAGQLLNDGANPHLPDSEGITPDVLRMQLQCPRMDYVFRYTGDYMDTAPCAVSLLARRWAGVGGQCWVLDVTGRGGVCVFRDGAEER